MNFQRGKFREEPEINLIPMIDVLLVILIFVMVTTTYSKFADLKINLPEAEVEQTKLRADEDAAPQFAEVAIEATQPPVTATGPSEARLDELLDEAARAARDPNSRRNVAAAFAKIAQHLGSTEAMDHVEDASLLQTARELLSPEYYVRQ